MGIQNTLDKTIMTFIIFLFLASALLISYFGNPITDESFPFAIAMRFIQGQKPFIDDYSPFMTIGLLLLPLVKLSLFLHDGKNELILFMRHSFILFQFGLGVYAFFTIKRYLSPILAFFCAALIFMYHPFGINLFHYDTLCTSLWSVIVYQAASFLIHNKHSLLYHVSFSCLGAVLCLAYPTFGLFIILFYLGLSFFITENKKFLLSNLTITLIVGLILSITIFYYYKIHYSNIINSIHASKAILNFYAHDSFLNKCTVLFPELIKQYYKYVLLALGVTLVGKYIRKNWVLFILMAATFAMPLYSININYADIFYFFNCIGFLAAILYIVFLQKNKLARLLFYCVWIPALGAGLLTIFTSSNGNLNFNIGFFPASILAFIYSYFIFDRYQSIKQIRGKLIFIQDSF